MVTTGRFSLNAKTFQTPSNIPEQLKKLVNHQSNIQAMRKNSMSLQFISYDITWDAIKTYPRSKELTNISIEMCYLLNSDPKKAYQQLQIVTKKYQNDPTLEVYLVTSLAASEGMSTAKAFITKNY